MEEKEEGSLTIIGGDLNGRRTGKLIMKKEAIRVY